MIEANQTGCVLFPAFPLFCIGIHKHLRAFPYFFIPDRREILLSDIIRRAKSIPYHCIISVPTSYLRILKRGAVSRARCFGIKKPDIPFSAFLTETSPLSRQQAPYRITTDDGAKQKHRIPGSLPSCVGIDSVLFLFKTQADFR